jgi:hypothetical protein
MTRVSTMTESVANATFSAAVVASIEKAIAMRRAPEVVAPGDMRHADQLLLAMRTVKIARFNAAERLEWKNMLSLFTMSMASLYFVGLSIWQAIYATQITEATNRLLTLVSIMSSVFTLILALIETMNDYKIKAFHMHACALAVNDLYQELKLLSAPGIETVQGYRKRYNEIVRGCPYNHARVDYLMAKAEGGNAWDAKAWACTRYVVNVFALYGVFLFGPPVVFFLFL